VYRSGDNWLADLQQRIQKTIEDNPLSPESPESPEANNVVAFQIMAVQYAASR
jgi:hypothetical protein